MNNILLKKNRFFHDLKILAKPPVWVYRKFSKDDKNDEEAEKPSGERQNTGKDAIFHDKAKSIQEESYFHKEGLEILKKLKNKLKKKGDADEEKNKS